MTHPRSATTRATARSGRARDAATHGGNIEHLAPTDGLVPPALAKHVAIAGEQRQQRRQVHPHQAARPRVDGLGAEHPHPHRVLARSDVRDVGAASRHRVVERGEDVERGVDGSGGVPPLRRNDRVTSTDGVRIDARQVERDAVARRDPRHLTTQRLDEPDSRPMPAGLHRHDVTDRQRPVGQGACHHRAASRRGEGAVDPQARPVPIAGGRHPADQCVQLGDQTFDADDRTTSGHRDWNDRCVREERARHVVGDLEHRQLDVVVVIQEIRLGECDHAVTHADQLEDAQVFLALGLPTFGAGDHEDTGVDRADAGQHVAQEPDVAGHVDEADRLAGRQRRMGEAEVDGETPALLLGPAVRVGAGQREHQRRLAVVDVAGGGDDAHPYSNVA